MVNEERRGIILSPLFLRVVPLMKAFPSSAVSRRVRRSSSRMNPLEIALAIASEIFVLTSRGDRRHGMKERPAGIKCMYFREL
jgi:hypothetical protein